MLRPAREERVMVDWLCDSLGLCCWLMFCGMFLATLAAFS